MTSQPPPAPPGWTVAELLRTPPLTLAQQEARALAARIRATPGLPAGVAELVDELVVKVY